jgi:hypothetical protein
LLCDNIIRPVIGTSVASSFRLASVLRSSRPRAATKIDRVARDGPFLPHGGQVRRRVRVRPPPRRPCWRGGCFSLARRRPPPLKYLTALLAVLALRSQLFAPSEPFAAAPSLSTPFYAPVDTPRTLTGTHARTHTYIRAHARTLSGDARTRARTHTHTRA